MDSAVRDDNDTSAAGDDDVKRVDADSPRDRQRAIGAERGARAPTLADRFEPAPGATLGARDRAHTPSSN